MESKRKRLTLDMEPAFQRRLKAMSALKGMSMRSYCQTAIDREVAKDESEAASGGGFNRQSFERIVAQRKELFRGIPLPGDSVELIREARGIRSAEAEEWA